MKNGGRAFIDELSSNRVQGGQRGTGNFDNPSWKLDKWKFLPMLSRTFNEFPDKQWYIFAEADTYIVWTTILVYQSNLNSSDPYYMGSQNWFGDLIFAHGGSGIIISQGALSKVTAELQAHQRYWENYTDHSPYGDANVADAFHAVDVSLTYTWPVLQGDKIGDMNYKPTDPDHRLWCQSAGSYHHSSPSTIERLWAFEQDWLASIDQGSPRYLRHKDMFELFVLPHTQHVHQEWDNHSEVDNGHADSIDDCRTTCESHQSCLQYTYTDDQRCFTTDRPNLGEESTGITSGWISDRMRGFYDNADPCLDED